MKWLKVEFRTHLRDGKTNRIIFSTFKYINDNFTGVVFHLFDIFNNYNL